MKCTKKEREKIDNYVRSLPSPDRTELEKEAKEYEKVLQARGMSKYDIKEKTSENDKEGQKEKGTCYLVAKKIGEHRSYAVRTESGKALAHLVAYLGLKTLDKKTEKFMK